MCRSSPLLPTLHPPGLPVCLGDGKVEIEDIEGDIDVVEGEEEAHGEGEEHADDKPVRAACGLERGQLGLACCLQCWRWAALPACQAGC